MTDLSKLSCCVLDHGMFVECALRLARDLKKTYYVDPTWEQAFSTIDHAVIGDGYTEIERVGEIWDVVDKVDFCVFPDVHHSGMQLHLEKMGMPVWGARKADELELKKVLFRAMQRHLGMEVPEYEVVIGLEDLRKRLQADGHEDEWVKISPQFRGCFDGKTEILTGRGWKLFKDLNAADLVVTQDVETGKAGLRAPSRHVCYWHDGPMLHIKGRGIDALVTPDHCLWAKADNRTKRWKYETVSSLKRRRFMVPQTCAWTGDEIKTYVLPNHYQDSRHSNRPKNQTRPLSMDRMLEFLGWFCSEGSLDLAGPKRNKYRIKISQSWTANAEKCVAIKSCVDALGFNAHRESSGGYSIYNKSLWIELAQMCYDHFPQKSYTKRAPSFLGLLSPRQIRIFLESYRAGDGSNDRRSGTNTFYTTSYQLASDVQELLLKTGSGASISKCARRGSSIDGRKIKSRRDSYVIREKRCSVINVLPSGITEQDYAGWVYDVSVRPFHSILVRRNGKAFWSGNSRETFQHKRWELTREILDELGSQFGIIQDNIHFLCEKNIDAKLEGGLDTYTVDGQHPNVAVQGYERKDQAYFAVVQPWNEIPKELTSVSDALWPELKERRCRQMISSEVKITDDKRSILLEPTIRVPSPAGEEQFELYGNFSEIIAEGAAGRLVQPTITARFACEAMVEHNGDDCKIRALEVPDSVRQWVKLYCTARVGKLLAIAPGSAVIGAVVGVGDSPAEALDHLKDNAAALKDQPVKVHVHALAELLQEIEEAQDKGIHFTDQPMPEPGEVVEEHE